MAIGLAGAAFFGRRLHIFNKSFLSQSIYLVQNTGAKKQNNINHLVKMVLLILNVLTFTSTFSMTGFSYINGIKMRFFTPILSERFLQK